MNESQGPRVAFEHPANRGILKYLGGHERLKRSLSVAKNSVECAPDAVKDAYHSLGTHPELVERLWEQLTRDIPEDCRWIVYGTPALVHPSTGIVFGFGGGTSTLALRLSPAAAEAACKSGATTQKEYPFHQSLGVAASRLDLRDIGPGWIFGHWNPLATQWCLSAYEFASNR